MPIFESQTAPLTKGWVLDCVDGGPKAMLETTNYDGREVLHVRIPPGATICSVRQRLSLPAGSYQISGRIKMRGTPVGNNFSLTPQCTLRCSTSRFGEDISSTEWTYQQFGFQIARGPAPEEIEMIWSFWRGSGDVCLDVSSLRLQKVGR